MAAKLNPKSAIGPQKISGVVPPISLGGLSPTRPPSFHSSPHFDFGHVDCINGRRSNLGLGLLSKSDSDSGFSNQEQLVAPIPE